MRTSQSAARYILLPTSISTPPTHKTAHEPADSLQAATWTSLLAHHAESELVYVQFSSSFAASSLQSTGQSSLTSSSTLHLLCAVFFTSNDPIPTPANLFRLHMRVHVVAIDHPSDHLSPTPSISSCPTWPHQWLGLSQGFGSSDDVYTR
uniref:Uncharacterized protein n=1 Tax=Mycena chlorophos TaxID=658473 RepID=A0ABQ0LM02_MYCCL|nr:predicted protein [Mycena chlorophos]